MVPTTALKFAIGSPIPMKTMFESRDGPSGSKPCAAYLAPAWT